MSASLVFFANGFVVASWLSHIPEVKERLGLDDFLLGIALFSMAAGSVLVLPLAGWSAGRFGSDLTTRTAGLALCLLLPAPVVYVVFMGLHVFVAFLQAYIFMLLSMVYVRGAVAHDH